MEYEDAKAIGDVGERAVAAALERLSAKHGFHVINNVLVQRGKGTTQVDHVVVDRFGVLMVETKTLPSAVFIRGTYADKKWTACYPGTKNETFPNPIQQSLTHENMLRQVLNDERANLSPDDVQSLIIFVDTDISKLELDSVNKLKCMDVSGVDAYFEGRDNFYLNPGTRSPEQVAELARLVSSVNRSDDPLAVAAHAANVRRFARKPSKIAPAPAVPVKPVKPAPAPVVPAKRYLPPQISPTPSPSETITLEHFTKMLIALAIVIVVAVLVGLLLYSLSMDAVRGVRDVPEWVWVAVIVFAALLVPGASSSKRRYRRSRKRASSSGQASSPVAALATMALAIVVLVTLPSWSASLSRYFDSLYRPSLTPEPAPKASAAPQPNPVTTRVAEQRLLELSPTVYSKVTDRGSPDISIKNGVTFFTWHYVNAVGNRATVRSYTLGLDQSGRVVHVGD